MIEKFLKRTTIRDYQDYKFNNKELKMIKDIINSSPTSTNSNQFSAIIVQNQDIKNKIAELNWHQKHLRDASALVIFLVDRTRMLEPSPRHGQKPTKNMKMHDYQRGIIDGTIAATYLQDALLTLGYGSGFIGGIPAYGNKLANILNIPKTAFPFLGLSIGKINSENEIKPKLNKVFMETYSEKDTKKEFWDYNNRTRKYFSKRRPTDYATQIADQTNDKGVYGDAFDISGKYYHEKLKEFK